MYGSMATGCRRREPTLAMAVVVLSLVAGGCGSEREPQKRLPPMSAAAGASTAPRFSDPRTIDNRYLPITERGRCEHRGVERDGTRTRSIQRVLEDPKRFRLQGQTVDAVVVEDRAYADGALVEVTLDYFAQADDGTVYYLGEDVDNLEEEKVIDHAGSWLYGRDTDVPGVAMPAEPGVGDQFRFEDVPGVTAESNRVEEVAMRAAAGGKVHTDVIRIQEFIQPEGEIEYKLYAPGVGLFVEYPPDGRSELVGCR